MESSEETASCCIFCQDAFYNTPDLPLMTTQCGHCFHRDCIASWLRVELSQLQGTQGIRSSVNKVCPICNTKVNRLSRLYVQFANPECRGHAAEIDRLNDALEESSKSQRDALSAARKEKDRADGAEEEVAALRRALIESRQESQELREEMDAFKSSLKSQWSDQVDSLKQSLNEAKDAKRRAESRTSVAESRLQSQSQELHRLRPANSAAEDFATRAWEAEKSRLVAETTLRSAEAKLRARSLPLPPQQADSPSQTTASDILWTRNGPPSAVRIVSVCQTRDGRRRYPLIEHPLLMTRDELEDLNQLEREFHRWIPPGRSSTQSQTIESGEETEKKPEIE